MSLPRNWPDGFRYSAVSEYMNIAPNLFRHLLSTLLPDSHNHIALCIENQNVHPNLEIHKITDPSHPLVGQHGVFAKHAILCGEDLGEYVGEIFFGPTDPDTPRTFKGVHCWRISLGLCTFNISSERIANELAFVNDFRGIQKEPNVQTKWILHRGNYHFGFSTTREIKPREELLVDYGKTWAQTASKK